jgi:hypothetical protein
MRSGFSLKGPILQGSQDYEYRDVLGVRHKQRTSANQTLIARSDRFISGNMGSQVQSLLSLNSPTRRIRHASISRHTRCLYASRTLHNLVSPPSYTTFYKNSCIKEPAEASYIYHLSCTQDQKHKTMPENLSPEIEQIPILDLHLDLVERTLHLVPQ